MLVLAVALALCTFGCAPVKDETVLKGKVFSSQDERQSAPARPAGDA